MKKADRDIIRLERLLDRFKFTQPVPVEIKSSMSASKKPVLVRVLKTAGSFSVIYGIYISISFFVKKAIVGITIAKIIMSATITTSIIYGCYKIIPYIQSQLKTGVAPVEDSLKPVPEEKIYRQPGEKELIILYDGRTIKGMVASRGDIYRILTAGGMITVPKNKIRKIEPVK